MIRDVRTLLLLGLLPVLQQAPRELLAPGEGRAAPSWPGELRIDRGEEPALFVPRDEKLRYRVHVALVGVPISVGTVTMSSRVEPYRESLLVTGTDGHTSDETALLTIHAKGDYQLYSMDATIETRVLPQEWPRIAYRYTHEGTENRRNEVLLGRLDGVETASYRRDTNKGAPKGTRIWREPTSREVPPDVLDMLSAVYLARTLVREEHEELQFFLIDKLHIWDMTIRPGERRRMEVEAGSFDVVEIQLDPHLHEGEDLDEEKVERFEGLFGMQGSIHLWVEPHTGVPVRIQGDLPVGFLKIGVDIELEGFEGTPPDFRPRD